jgi:hypothetical protein
LTLELPYKTDTESVLYARAHETLEKLRLKDLSALKKENSTINNDLLDPEEQRERLRNCKMNAHTLILTWICLADSGDIKKIRMVVAGILQRWIMNFFGLNLTFENSWKIDETISLQGEDLAYYLNKETMKKIIGGIGYWFNFVQGLVGSGFARPIFFVGHGIGHALLIQTALLRSGFASLGRTFGRN